MKNKGSRPPKEIKLEMVEKLASIGCTGEEIATVLDCCRDTLYSRFSDCLKKGQHQAKVALRRLQWQLRNPVYVGKIYVPTLGDEEGYLANGLHQAIVAEKTFWNVQHILSKRLKENVHLVAKEKLRAELPLRGHLKCPDCGRNLTGSLSSGNGGRYAYYHCHRGCKRRVSALEVNEKFNGYLQSLRPKPEVAELYLAMMEDIFKLKEGDREQQLNKLKKQLVSLEANLLKFDQQRFVTGELEADSYNCLKRHTQNEIDKLKLEMEDFKLSDTAFEKYSRYGISLLTHMDIYFQIATKKGMSMREYILEALAFKEAAEEEENIEMDNTSFRKGLKRIRKERSQLAKNLSKR